MRGVREGGPDLYPQERIVPADARLPGGRRQGHAEVADVTEPRGTFLSFAAIRIAVSALDAAVSAWREQLGWRPETVSADGASFRLDGAVVDIVPAAADQPPGVTAVAVTV